MLYAYCGFEKKGDLLCYLVLMVAKTDNCIKYNKYFNTFMEANPILILNKI